MLLCRFCGFLLTPVYLPPALLTWASFLKPSSSYLLSPPYHTYNPSVLSRNLKLFNLFPFPLFHMASPSACSCFSSSLFCCFFTPRRLPPTLLTCQLGSDAVRFQDLRLIQQRLHQKLLLIKKMSRQHFSHLLVFLLMRTNEMKTV